MLSFLEVADGFIQLASTDYNEAYKDWLELPNQVKIRLLDVGVLEVLPAEPSNQALVISCGIHGNETAPMEIVSQQISQIVTGQITPKTNILYILGNPESLLIGERFVALNMNRLFAGAHANYPVDNESRYELERAARLEVLVSEFYQQFPSARKMHLDLHTAIKPSFHKTFAIRPYSHTALSDESRKLLLAFGIEAVLHHNKPSTTFSYFSSAKFNAEAYTLELGKVKPFGENDLEDFSAAVKSLDALVQNSELSDANPANLTEYKVVAEIIKNSDQFKFYVPEDVENFTAYPQGYLIAEDFDYNYRVAFEREAVVFPNTKVPIGQRVAVMVTEINYQE